jgi:hypothetical protein
MDKLNDQQLMIVNKLLFEQVAEQILQEHMINSSKYGLGIFEFIRACISFILPLRLHDSKFLTMVTDTILNKEAFLYSNGIKLKHNSNMY